MSVARAVGGELGVGDSEGQVLGEWIGQGKSIVRK